MRSITSVCDWCHAELDVEELDPVEMGWTHVERFDTIQDEVVNLDFCSAECVVSFFND